MENNVLSWTKALNMGFNPSAYPYQTSAIPIGEFTAVLDFKIWAKKVIAIACYFTLPDANVRFQVTIYHRTGIGYKIAKEGVDFTTCKTGKAYRITTAIRHTGKAFVKAAVAIGEEDIQS